MAQDADFAAQDGSEGALDGEKGSERPVLDASRVDSAIRGAFDAFSQLDLTVAEAIQAVISMKASLESSYPEVFKIMRELKSAEKPEGGLES